VKPIELDPNDEFDQLVLRCCQGGTAPGADAQDRFLMELAIRMKEDMLEREKRIERLRKTVRYATVMQRVGAGMLLGMLIYFLARFFLG
jgi:hypothetical protein